MFNDWWRLGALGPTLNLFLYRLFLALLDDQVLLQLTQLLFIHYTCDRGDPLGWLLIR